MRPTFDTMRLVKFLDFQSNGNISNVLPQSLYDNKQKEKSKKNENRLSVERIYQKKTQLEHILLRPDSYIGSVEPVTQVELE